MAGRKRAAGSSNSSSGVATADPGSNNVEDVVDDVEAESSPTKRTKVVEKPAQKPRGRKPKLASSEDNETRESDSNHGESAAENEKEPAAKGKGRPKAKAESAQSSQEANAKPAAKGKGRKQAVKEPIAEESEPNKTFTKSAEPASSRGKKAVAAKDHEVSASDNEESDEVPELAPAKAPAKGRGRPKKSTNGEAAPVNKKLAAKATKKSTIAIPEEPESENGEPENGASGGDAPPTKAEPKKRGRKPSASKVSVEH